MDDITIRRIKVADIEEVMMLLKRNLYTDEPLIKKLGYYTIDDDCTELDAYCESILPGYSYKAVSNGKIIGVIVTDAEDNMPVDYKKILEQGTYSKLAKMLQLLDIREQGAQINTMFKEDYTLLVVKMVAIEAAWRNRGVMKRLLKETEKIAEEHHLRLIRMDTTNQFASQAAESVGFKCVYQASYIDVQLAGEPIAVPDPPHEYDRVYIKELYNLSPICHCQCNENY